MASKANGTPAFEFVNVQKSYNGSHGMTPVERFVHSQTLQKEAFDAIVNEGEKEYTVNQRGRQERIRPLWFNQSGEVYYRLKFGNRNLIVNNANAIKVGELDNVPAAIDFLIAQANDGKLDDVIEEAAKTMRRRENR